MTSIDDKEIALATEHPRGTERRRLLPYRDALQSPEAYARLAVAQRDEIVRWAELRRLIRQRSGIDKDPGNLVDPLIPFESLRRLVVEGEQLAAGADLADDGGDLLHLVARIRGAAR